MPNHSHPDLESTCELLAQTQETQAKSIARLEKHTGKIFDKLDDQGKDLAFIRGKMEGS